MKHKSIKVYKLTKAFNNNGRIVLIAALFVAVFCLPKISSWAYEQLNTPGLLAKIQYQIRQEVQPIPKIMTIYVTAYTSSPEETDDTPCITASGYNLCEHNLENVVACNFLPFGTKIIFPDLDPEKIYTVVDRMHERFNSRIDIWKKSAADARKFGVKKLKVEIYQ